MEIGDKIICYRIQHSVSGKGPFSHYADSWARDAGYSASYIPIPEEIEKMARCHDGKVWPSILEDFNRFQKKEEYCVVQSLDLLYFWFGDYLNTLSLNHFLIVRCEGILSAISSKQCLVTHLEVLDKILPEEIEIHEH